MIRPATSSPTTTAAGPRNRAGAAAAAVGLLRNYPLVAAGLVVLIAGLVLRAAGQSTAAAVLAGGFAALVGLWTAVGMVREMVRGHWGLDLLAVSAIAATLAVGEDLAALIIVLMLTGGRGLEEFAAGRARRELTALLAGMPAVAHRSADDAVVDVPVDEVGPGELLLVRPGEVVPVDGALVSPAGVFDESSLTGESLPVERVRGEQVLSGALNGTGAVLVRAGATAADSQYARIVDLVREAADSRAPVVRLADRYAMPFTAFAFLVAGLGWWMSGTALRLAEVLVVATPCPLLLAAPIAFLGGMSSAARHGVIVKGASVLEQLARIRTVAFDKTGTLTQGRPELRAVLPENGCDADTVLGLAASAEQYSSHTLAASVVAAARDRGVIVLPADEAEEVATNGVRARVGGHQVHVGKPAFVGAAIGSTIPEPPLGPGELAAYVGIDGAMAGVLILRDAPRPEARHTLERLSRAGVDHVLMLTGDTDATARSIAGQVGVPEVRSRLLPLDKVEIVRTAQPRPVLMVGDGVNDAPVLAAADVGIAMGARGSTAASESADAVVLVEDISRTATAIEIAQRTVRVALQSIWLGIGLSVGLMGFALTGALPPIAGALSQELVDLATILNALRAIGDGHHRVGSRR